MDRRAFNKQHNHVVSLLRNKKKKKKKNFYSNLDTKVVKDNIIFWKTVKPFLSEKVTKHSKINLAEGEKIISCDEQIVKTFGEYFINISNLNMPSHGLCPNLLEPDPILRIIHK